jgi:uncharacterized protein
MPNPIVHFEILGKDGAKSQKWYSDIFGWKVDAQPMPGMPEGMTYGTVSAQDDRGIGGGITGVMPGSGPSTCIYVEVADPQAVLDKIEKAGGKVVMPVTEIPNVVTFAQFADPDGNVLGLVKAGTMG